MSLKNLSAPSKTHRYFFNNLKDKRIFNIYNKFEKNLKLNENFIVAVSGGPDSLALAFLAKIYSIKNRLNANFFIVDHKLRKNSSYEAKYVKNLFKNLSIKIDILKWNGKKPDHNIQSIARKKRHSLLFSQAKKLNIKNILFGHHLDDLFENFFIRMIRGSGLNGLISFDEKTQDNSINFFRPLIEIDKDDLIYISKKVFGDYIEDPSNNDDKYKRVKIRGLIKNLQLEGLDRNKFKLTLQNLKYANQVIKFYSKKNIINNTNFYNKKKSIILSKEFFDHPKEIVFRSLTEIIRAMGKKYYPVRGRKLDKVIDLINNSKSFKITLGNCIIKKVNHSVIISKELKTS